MADQRTPKSGRRRLIELLCMVAIGVAIVYIFSPDSMPRWMRGDSGDRRGAVAVPKTAPTDVPCRLVRRRTEGKWVTLLAVCPPSTKPDDLNRWGAFECHRTGTLCQAFFYESGRKIPDDAEKGVQTIVCSFGFYIHPYKMRSTSERDRRDCKIP